MAPSRMLVLQDQEWLPVWGEVLICTPSDWWTADEKVKNEWWQKCCGYAEEGQLVRKRIRHRPMSRSIGETWQWGVIKSWEQKSSKRQSSDARQLGCVFQDMKPPKSISPEGHRHAETNPTCEVHKGYRTSYQKFETKIPRSVTFVQVNLMSVAPTAPKFEDRSQEETDWQEQGAREAAWKLAKKCV